MAEKAAKLDEEHIEDSKVTIQPLSGRQEIWVARADAFLRATVPVFFNGQNSLDPVDLNRHLGQPEKKDRTSKEKQGFGKRVLPVVPPYAVEWNDREKAKEQATAGRITYVNHFAEDPDDRCAPELIDTLGFSMSAVELGQMAPFRFQMPPRASKACEHDSVDYPPHLRRMLLESCLVLESVVTSAPQKVTDQAWATAYYRCTACGGIAISCVEIQCYCDLEELEKIDFLEEFIARLTVHTQEPGEMASLKGGWAVRGGKMHLLSREHWGQWEQYGGPLSWVLGLAAPGCGQRHVSQLSNRSPFEIKLGDKLWVPLSNEGCTIPALDVIECHIGKVQFLLPATWELLKSKGWREGQEPECQRQARVDASGRWGCRGPPPRLRVLLHGGLGPWRRV